MKFNIAITAAVLAAVLTSLTSALAPSARGLRQLREADKANWNRLSESVCLGCGSEKASTRAVLTDPIAVLAAAPRSTSFAVADNSALPKVRVAGTYRRYASLRRNNTQRHAARMRKERDHLASLKLKYRIKLATLTQRSLESVREEEAILSGGITLESDRD